MENFGKKLTELRGNIPRKHIAESLGFNHITYMTWEKDRCEPSLDAIVKICSHFNVSADYLLGLSEESKQSVVMTNANGNNSSNVKQTISDCANCPLMSQLDKLTTAVAQLSAK